MPNLTDIVKDIELTKVKHINTIAGLQGLELSQIEAVFIGTYHDITDASGGGLFVKATGRHNGGTFIDIARPFPTDWDDQEQLAAWFEDSGVDVNGWKRVYDGPALASFFGAKADATTDDFKPLQKALSVSVHVVVGRGTHNCSGMLIVKTNQTLELSSDCIIRRFAATSSSTDPLVWLRDSGASLIGVNPVSSGVTTENRCPLGVVRIGHENMTVSPTTVSNCFLKDILVGGNISGGQTSGAPDVAVYIPNAQIGGNANYFHTISNLRLQLVNYGIHLHGWANGNLISDIHGFLIGNVASGHNAMFWLDGALDNDISASFFHTATDSIGVKVTNFDNTAVAGGSLHEVYANSVRVICEQGGAAATGLWTDVVGGDSFYEIRHNVSGGNVVPVGFYDNNVLIGLGGIHNALPKGILIETDGTDNRRVALKSDGKFLLGADVIASPDAESKFQMSGNFRNNIYSTNSYTGTGDIVITINHGIAVTGAVHENCVIELLYCGADAGLGVELYSKYIIGIIGLSTWDIRTPVLLGGDALTITQVSSSNVQTVIKIEGGTGVNGSAIASAVERFGAVLV